MAKLTRNGNSDPDFKVADMLLTEVTFDRKDAILHILDFLRREKVSGTLTLDIALGGVTRTRFVQKQEVDIVSSRNG